MVGAGVPVQVPGVTDTDDVETNGLPLTGLITVILGGAELAGPSTIAELERDQPEP